MTTYLGKSCSFCLPRVPFVNCRQFMYLVIPFWFWGQDSLQQRSGSLLGWPLIIESSYPILLPYASLCISWLRKIQSYFWKDQCHTAFDTLKQLLTTALILSFPLQQDQPFLLDCDASNVGVGTVLSQVQDGEEKVICYFSKCLSRSERLYCTTRKELLAVVMAVNISITIWLVKILQLELIMGHFSGSCGLKTVKIFSLHLYSCTQCR